MRAKVRRVRGGSPKVIKWEKRDFNQLSRLESKEGGSPGPSDPNHIGGGRRGLGGGFLDEEKRKLLQDAKLRTEVGFLVCEINRS